jgi:CubicO group peptidase (beta-lactamase class C family)
MDSEALAALFDRIQADAIPIHSLLVIRHGHLVLEAYFHPYTGASLHGWASVTKSITSTLVGCAVDAGYIESVRQPLADFLPEYRDTLPEGKRRITVEHLLTMSSGFDCGYRSGELETLAMEESPDFVASALSLPLVKEPGSEFSYCSPGMHLLSAVVTRASGMSALDFARQRLFDPLGIGQATWPADPQGINHGWSDLRMHPRDMAKIGYLYLHDGQWQDKPVVASGWVRRSTRQQIRPRKGDSGYGYGWWIRSGDLSGLYEADGRGGQGVSVWPEKDLVVVMNGAGLERGVLAPYLRAALKSDSPLPENAPAYAHLRERIAAAARPPRATPAAPPPALADAVSGRTYFLEPNLLGIKTLGLNFTQRHAAGLDIRVRSMHLVSPVGLDGIYRLASPGPGEPTVAARGYWRSASEFVLDYTEADGINHFLVSLDFKARAVAITLEDLTRHFPPQYIKGEAPD